MRSKRTRLYRVRLSPCVVPWFHLAAALLPGRCGLHPGRRPKWQEKLLNQMGRMARTPKRQCEACLEASWTPYHIGSAKLRQVFTLISTPIRGSDRAPSENHMFRSPVQELPNVEMTIFLLPLTPLARSPTDQRLRRLRPGNTYLGKGLVTRSSRLVHRPGAATTERSSPRKKLTQQLHQRHQRHSELTPFGPLMGENKG